LEDEMGGSTRTRAGEAAQAAGSNPYVRRLIEDQELRENLRVAFNAAKDAYARMSNGKGPARTLVDDKKVHKDLRTAAESLREASDQLRGKKKRKGGLGKLLLIGVAAAGLALVLSEDLRKAVLDRLFGAEEEFEYSSTTTSAESEAAPV
jgi:hypothetical protein